MQIVRFQDHSGPSWGLLIDDTVVPTTGPGGQHSGDPRPLAGLRLLAPVVPSKIVCGDVLAEPGLFLKGPNTLAAPGTQVPYPAWSQNFHFEGELAVVIGCRASHVSQAEALSYVLGYVPAFDLTARDKQKADLQWFRAKAADLFCPIGPVIDTSLDPSDVELKTWVNGTLRQHGHTRDLVFDIPTVIEYVTAFMTLEPGDVILTGTPEGVGPLAVGDTLKLDIEGLVPLEISIGSS
jgi:2-keto-4-pentenoate hydratase/2-oxohepta-3-ene-1,7-dioic acid hydratase in catechol pathway